MLRKISGLAAVLCAAGACHSGGTYLQSAEPRPYGPGVVDCSWFQRTENAYVRDRCMTPAPVAEVQYVVPTWPRAARGDPALGCPVPEPVVVAAPQPAAPVAAPVAATRTIYVQQPDAPAPRAEWRSTVPARDTSPPAVVVTARPAAPGSITITPGVTYGSGALPDWDSRPLPPPRPGAPLPAPSAPEDAWGR